MSADLSLGLDCPICGGRCIYMAYQPDAEYIQALPIASPTADARQEAIRLHHVWFKSQGDAGARHSFALALRRWGRLARKPDAIAQAAVLLAEAVPS